MVIDGCDHARLDANGPHHSRSHESRITAIESAAFRYTSRKLETTIGLQLTLLLM